MLEVTAANCPQCDGAISAKALICPHCRADLDPHKRRVHWIIGVGFVAIFFLVMATSSTS